MEEWKDIDGFEGYYQVSNHGRIKSCDRYVRVCGNGRRLIKSKIIKPMKCKNGYYEVMLHKKNKYKVILLHRLIALTFIPNPKDFKEVNHKDENIENNHVSNLEWCTSKYNANYGTRNKRVYKSHSYTYRKVNQYDLNGNFIQQWDSIAEAERGLGIIKNSAINACCRGIRRTSGGFKWEYADERGV